MWLVIAAGAVAGTGAWMVVTVFLPPAPPDLRAALRLLDSSQRLSAGSPRSRAAAWSLRLGDAVAERLPGTGVFAVPRSQLRVLTVDVGRFVSVRLGAAVGGLLIPLLLWPLLASVGAAPPLAVPAAVGVGLAAAGWAVPGAVVARRAAGVRWEFRIAVSAYLDLVALERAAGAGVIEALESAASIGRGPAFAAINGRLALAARTGATPWSALGTLADDLDVPELRHLVDIAASAADGAAVYATLLAASRSLRNALASDAQAEANAASERLVFPVALLGTGFLLLLFYPALARLLGNG
jgi:pilus assembly protein TadC